MDATAITRAVVALAVIVGATVAALVDSSVMPGEALAAIYTLVLGYIFGRQTSDSTVKGTKL